MAALFCDLVPSGGVGAVLATLGDCVGAQPVRLALLNAEPLADLSHQQGWAKGVGDWWGSPLFLS